MLPDSGVLLAAVVCGGIGGAIVLLIAGLRGVVVDPSRPPSRVQRARDVLTSRAMGGRLGLALLVGAGTLLFTRWPVAALGLAALIVVWPQLFGGTRAERAQINQLEALVIWTESLRDTIAAHASLERAIPASTQNAPPLIRPALIRLAGQINVRAPMDLALQGLAADLDDASADLVIAALILNIRRRGDRLAQVLGGLATAAREELDMRRTVMAGRAGLRRGVQIVVALTIGFAVYLTIVSPDYVEPYNSPAGQVALAVVAGLFAWGFTWMRKLAAGHAVQPFLHRPGAAISAADVQVVAYLTGLSSTQARQLSTAGNGMAPAISAPGQRPAARAGGGMQ